ncbi:TPA: hypothetical protein ACURMD_004379 [Escherichia coli]
MSNIEKIAELCQDKKYDKTSNGAAYGVYDVMKGGYKNGFSNTRKTPACRSRRGLPGFDARQAFCLLPGFGKIMRQYQRVPAPARRNH